MSGETKKCELCAEEIPVEVADCEYCGAQYDVEVKGYCSTDHQVVVADEDGLCPICGGELVDRQVDSRWIDDRVLVKPAEPSIEPAPPPVEVEIPSEAITQPSRYIAKHLRSGEVVIYQTRLYWGKLISAAVSFVLGILSLIAAGMLRSMALTSGIIQPGPEQLDWTSIYALVFSFLFFITGVSEVVGYFVSELAITNQRLLGRLGSLPRFVQVPMEQVAGTKPPTRLSARTVRVLRTNRRPLTIMSLPQPHKFQQILESQLPPSARPLPQKINVGKRIIIGCGGTLIVLMIAVAGVLLASGEYRRFIPAEEVDFSSIESVALWQKITIEGYLGLPTSINCTDECGIWLEDPADRENRIPLFLDTIRASSTPAPNRMVRLGYGFSESDLIVWIDSSLYVGAGDKVRITGVRCETTTGKVCIRDVSNIDALTPPAVAAMATQTVLSLTPEDTPTAAPTPLPVGAGAENTSAEPDIACFGHEGFGLTCLDENGWRQINPSNSQLNGDTIYTITLCPDGNFAIAHNQGLHIFDGQTFIGAISSRWGDEEVTALACDSQGGVFASYTGGLSRYEGGAWSDLDISDLASIEDPSAEVTISDMTIDLQGNLWVVVDWPTLEGSVARLSGEAWTVYSEADLGEEGGFHSIRPDHQGRIWVANNGGLSVFADEGWSYFDKPGTTILRDIFIDLDDRIWMAISDGFGVFDGDSWNIYTVDNAGQTPDNGQTLALDGQGRIWIPTSWGVTVLDGEAWTSFHMHTSDLAANNVISIAVRGAGPELPEHMEKEDGVVTGRLFEDGQLLTGSRVQLCVKSLSQYYSGATPCGNQPFIASGETDENGNFSIELPPGHYYLAFKITSGGWSRLTDRFGIASKRIVVHPGETVYLSDIYVSE